MIKIAIVGATGYTGAELVRLLSDHPHADIQVLTSETFAGQRLSDLYPALGEAGNWVLKKKMDVDLTPKNVDVVFLAVPHGESMHMTPGLVKAGVKVIDLSGDFRFPDTSEYEKWYQHKHTAKDLAAKAIYGLPELFRDDIKDANLVANPGCYVTSVVLSLYPLIKAGAVDTKSLVVDAKSGISGAGRKVQAQTQFNRVSENVIPYKLAGQHQHTPEMELALSQATGRDVVINFTPQIVPAKRGILSLAYGRLEKKMTTADLQELYTTAYASEPFVQVRTEQESLPELSQAVGTNLCLVSVYVDERTQTVTALGSLDNLIKGASGQAIQNMNLICGLDETLGLPIAGLIP